jgi:hypothetical protein
MIKKILIGLVVVIAIAIVVVATRPDTVHVERSATISAPTDVTFAFVNDFHQWGNWSPWSKLDPNEKLTYEGPANGVGESMSWVGNDKVGEGKMTITDSKPGASVAVKLEFIKPFPMQSDVEFAFAPAGADTNVKWGMTNHPNFMGKAMGMFMNMDKMVGPDFEKGLASMKTVAEAEAKKQADAKKTAEAPPPAEAQPAPQ